MNLMGNRAVVVGGMMLALVCAGCGDGGRLADAGGGIAGAGGGIADAGSAVPGLAHRKASVTFGFKIPRARHRNGAHYLSPATASIAVTVLDVHANQLAQATINTSPGVGDCSALVGGTFSCALTMSVLPGNDTFNVAAYDAANAQGNRLSAHSGPQIVLAGQQNAIDISLGGIPATLGVALVGFSPFAIGSPVSGYQFAGIGNGAAHQFQLTVKDADGYTIINPGAPVLTLTSSAPSKLAITAGGGAGLFDVTPLAETNALPTPNPSTAVTLTAAATPATGTGTNPLTVNVSVQNDPIAYVASTGSKTVEAFAPWTSSPILTLGPLDMNPTLPNVAVDVAGNVYVSDDAGGLVYVFPVGSTTSNNTLHVNGPEFMATDNSLNVYVDQQGAGNVVEYNPANDNQLVRTLAADEPYGIALDSAGNLYVANYFGTTGVSVFAAGTSTSPEFSISNGMNGPAFPTFDAAGNLYVTNLNAQNVTEYSPPFSSGSNAVNTFGTGQLSQPYGIAVDASGNVYVANSNPKNVLQFGPATPTTVSRTLTDGGATLSVAVDQLGYVYVPWGGGPVDVFPPASSGSTSRINSWTSGLDNPFNVAIWP
jgi:sugar lactone lactonase YvrE